jgi:DNA invertase Pin-like site-specific DNA recombinase
MRRAFSYLRFSKVEQGEGDSLRRQVQATESYCKRHGLILDKRGFTDLGVSGFDGGNATGGELAEFLQLVKDGRIPKGSVLIVENTDRLSRLPPDQASALICSLVRGGVDVVTTSPEATYTAANISKTATWLPLQISCALAHEESAKKGERMKEAWQQKRAAIGKGIKMTARCPCWLRLSDDRTHYTVIEEKAAMVRRAFALALEGRGMRLIVGALNREYPEGLTGRGWHVSFLPTILRGRAALGEYQPKVGTCAKKGGIKETSRPTGDPVKGYFPAIVDEATFYQAQAGLDARRKGGGGRATGTTPSLLTGVLKDAHDGHFLICHGAREKRRLLVSSGALRKLPGSVFQAVPCAEFEEATLRFLTELKVTDVVGPKNGAQADLEAASGRLTAVNHRIQQTQGRVATADDPAVFLDLLDQLGKDRKAVIAELEKAKQKVADEAGDTFGECCSLINLLGEAEGDEREDLRRRTKAALRRLVKAAYVLPVRRSKFCLIVAAQLWFDDRRHRDLLVTIGRRGRWWGSTLPPELARGDLDLRRADHVADLEQTLERLDLQLLAEVLGAPPAAG